MAEIVNSRKQKKFISEIAISLGWRCSAAQIAIESGKRPTKLNGYRTCVFDLMVSSYKGVIQAIKDDFKDFTNPEYLRVQKDVNESTIINTKYNFTFNHESPGHADLYIIQEWPGGINHYINNNFEKFIKRYNQRIQNFRNYLNSGMKIIFIITDIWDYDTTELDEVLRETYPNLNYSIEIYNEDPLLYQKSFGGPLPDRR